MIEHASKALASILTKWGSKYHQATAADLTAGNELLAINTDAVIELTQDPEKYAEVAVLEDPLLNAEDEVCFRIQGEYPSDEPYRMPQSKILEGEPVCDQPADYIVYLARNA